MPKNTEQWWMKQMQRKYEKLEVRYRESKALLKTAIKTLQS